MTRQFNKRWHVGLLILAITGISAGSVPPSTAETTLPNPVSNTCAIGGDVAPHHFSFDVLLPGNEKPSTYKLSQIFCNRAAYNTSELWLLEDQYKEIKILSFARPEFDVTYEDKEEQTDVSSIKVTGYAAATEISNSTFDPDKLAISSFHKWRGLGDASSAGTWVFYQGRFVLRSYDVDASWDGENNPQTIVDYRKSAK